MVSVIASDLTFSGSRYVTAQSRTIGSSSVKPVRYFSKTASRSPNATRYLSNRPFPISASFRSISASFSNAVSSKLHRTSNTCSRTRLPTFSSSLTSKATKCCNTSSHNPASTPFNPFTSSARHHPANSKSRCNHSSYSLPRSNTRRMALAAFFGFCWAMSNSSTSRQ